VREFGKSILKLELLTDPADLYLVSTYIFLIGKLIYINDLENFIFYILLYVFEKKKYKELDFINNTTEYQKPKLQPRTKILNLIKELVPDPEVKPKEEFKRPTTDEEFKTFHKTNEDGLKKAYAAPEGYFKDGNKLYIAGTRDSQDVFDWSKIVLGTFKNSKIYKNAEVVFKNNPDIDTVIGHSAGGSATLELEKNYPDRKITSITYNAPIFSPFSAEQFLDKTKSPLRFAVVGDPVSALDMNAQTTFHAPDINLDVVKDSLTMFAAPSLDNALKVANSIKSFDPLMGLHTIDTSYSKPSTTMDFVKSGIAGVAAVETMGII